MPAQTLADRMRAVLPSLIRAGAWSRQDTRFTGAHPKGGRVTVDFADGALTWSWARRAKEPVEGTKPIGLFRCLRGLPPPAELPPDEAKRMLEALIEQAEADDERQREPDEHFYIYQLPTYFLWRAMRCSKPAGHVALDLLTRASYLGSDKITVSYRELARWGLALTAAKEAIQDLEDARLVEVVERGRGQTKSTYQLVFTPLWREKRKAERDAARAAKAAKAAKREAKGSSAGG